MTIYEFRNTFPHIREGRIIFDHAALGPLCDKVRNSIDEYLDQRSLLYPDFFERFLVKERNAKEQLGIMLNVPKERIAWIDNVSNGLNVLAQGITWKPGDRVILFDCEFPSNIYPFLNLTRQGVEVDFVKSKNGIINTNDIEKIITPRTRLLSVSFVQFLSGYRIDVKTLGDICKKHGIIYCVDGIQGAGVVEIDIPESNIDFFVGGTQKWLMALMGLSYFYISEELQQKLDQKYVGWLSVKDAWNLLDYKLELKDTAESFQTGTMPAIGIVALNSVLEVFLSFGITEIEKSIVSNTKYFIEKLGENNFYPVLKDMPDENLAGIITFPHEKPAEVMKHLNRNGVIGSVREGMIRFSPHFYNTKEEIDRVVALIKEWK
ncbi:MAG: aminotransferase class V-fold PLP-dependent enzyme [bacterium]